MVCVRVRTCASVCVCKCMRVCWTEKFGAAQTVVGLDRHFTESHTTFIPIGSFAQNLEKTQSNKIVKFNDCFQLPFDNLGIDETHLIVEKSLRENKPLAKNS